MTGRGARRGSRAAAALAAAVLLLARREARAEGLSLTASPNYGTQSTTVTLADGSTTRSEASTFGHTYRLGLDRALYPRLTFSGGGTFDQQIGWTALPGPASRNDALNWSAFGRLGFGSEVLGGGLSYDRAHDWSAARRAGLSSRSPTMVREAYAGSLTWLPADLPKVTVSASRSDSYDIGRRSVDQASLAAGLFTAYAPVKNLDLSYSLTYQRPEDRLTGTVSSTIGNSARASYSGQYLGKRGSYFTSYGISTSTSDTRAGPGGTVATPQFPINGFSAVEVFATDSARIKLDGNPALIDGNTGTAAGIDLGFRLSMDGDVLPRDVGVEMAFPYPKVTRLFVWVDKALPLAVANAFAWTAWQSDDNDHWTQVPLAGSVEFGLQDNRFEIPIQETRARYVKVVTRPLPIGVTTERTYERISVTEIQVHEVVAVSGGHLRTSNTSGNLLASTRILLLEGKETLSFDSTGNVAHGGQPVVWGYMLVNGLSYGRPLGDKARLSARAERSDADAGAAHTAANRVASSVAYHPLPTLAHSVGASTELRQTAAGEAISGAVSLTNRAQILPTVGVSAGGTYSRSRSEAYVYGQGATATSGLSLVPHSTAAANVSYSYNWSETQAGGEPARSSSGQTLNVALSWNPYPAVYFAGSMTRTWIRTPTTLFNFSGGWSPLRDGEVQLSFSYSESYQDVSRQRTRNYGPSLRWNIRPGVYLEASYTESRVYSPVQTSLARSFFVSMFVPVL